VARAKVVVMGAERTKLNRDGVDGGFQTPISLKDRL